MSKDTKHYAKTIFDAQIYEGVIESELDQLIGGDGVEKMWFDSYDGSIEICVHKDCQAVNEQMMELLARYGFTMGWVNFSDGTEQHFSNSKLNDRKPVPHPRWTEEIRNREFLGIREEGDAR